VLGGTEASKDKIYVAFGQTIQGLKKKGVEFFRFNTSLNEDIQNMYASVSALCSLLCALRSLLSLCLRLYMYVL
jgi:F0F1-type ATP synthase membrane subunit a